MKQIFSIVALAASLVLPASLAAAGPAFSQAELKALNNEHVRIVRQAQRGCATSFHRGFYRYNHRNPCVVGDVERAVRALEKPALLTFHNELPMRVRFDTQRGVSDVQRFFN